MKASFKESDISKELASEESEKRKAIFEKLEKTLGDQKLTEDRYKKIWRGICQGLNELKGAKNQNEVINKATSLILKLSSANKKNIYKWLRLTLEAILQDWNTNTRFQNLTRSLLTEIYVALASDKKELEQLKQFGKTLWEFLHIQLDLNENRTGFAKQILDYVVVALEEVNKPSHASLEQALEPFLDLILLTKSKVVLNSLVNNIFLAIRDKNKKGGFSSLKLKEYAKHVAQFTESNDIPEANLKGLISIVTGYGGQVKPKSEGEIVDEKEEKSTKKSNAKEATSSKRKRAEVIQDIKNDAKKGKKSKEDESSNDTKTTKKGAKLAQSKPSVSPSKVKASDSDSETKNSKKSKSSSPDTTKKSTTAAATTKNAKKKDDSTEPKKGSKKASSASPEKSATTTTTKKGKKKADASNVEEEIKKSKKATKKSKDKIVDEEDEEEEEQVETKQRKSRSKKKKDDEMVEETKTTTTQAKRGRKRKADTAANGLSSDDEDGDEDLTKRKKGTPIKIVRAHTSHSSKPKSKKEHQLVRRKTKSLIQHVDDGDEGFESDEDDYLDNEDEVDLSNHKRNSHKRKNVAAEQESDDEQDNDSESEDEDDDDDMTKGEDSSSSSGEDDQAVFDEEDDDDQKIQSILGNIPEYFYKTPAQQRKFFEKLQQEFDKNLDRAKKMKRDHDRIVHFVDSRIQYKEFKKTNKVSGEKTVPSIKITPPKRGILRKPTVELTTQTKNKKVSGKPQKKVKL